MHFGLILWAVGLLLGAANAQFPDIDQLALELQTAKKLNNAMQEKVTKLQLSLTEIHYKKEQVKSLKENISVLKLKCDSNCDAAALKAKINELESVVKIYKALTANDVGLPSIPLEIQLKNCQAQLGQPWSPLAGTNPGWINPAWTKPATNLYPDLRSKQ